MIRTPLDVGFPKLVMDAFRQRLALLEITFPIIVAAFLSPMLCNTLDIKTSPTCDACASAMIKSPAHQFYPHLWHMRFPYGANSPDLWCMRWTPWRYFFRKTCDACASHTVRIRLDVFFVNKWRRPYPIRSYTSFPQNGNFAIAPLSKRLHKMCCSDFLAKTKPKQLGKQNTKIREQRLSKQLQERIRLGKDASMPPIHHWIVVDGVNWGT